MFNRTFIHFFKNIFTQNIFKSYLEMNFKILLILINLIVYLTATTSTQGIKRNITISNSTRSKSSRNESYSELANQCPIFKNKKLTLSMNRNLNISTYYYNESHHFYMVTDMTLISNETANLYQKYYRYIETFNKSKNTHECHKIESVCLSYKIHRVIPLRERCYKMDEVSPFHSLITSLKNGNKKIFLENYFEKINTHECEILFNNSNNCTTMVDNNDINKFKYHLVLNLINNYKTKIFYALNTSMTIIGLLTNLFSMTIFLTSLQKSRKIFSAQSLTILTFSNMVFLITNWVIFIKPISLSSINFYIGHSTFYKIIYCKLFMMIDAYTFLLSELMLVKVTLLRALTLTFPTNLKQVKMKLQMLVKYSNLVISVIAFLIPFGTEFLNILLHTNENSFLSEKKDISSYCKHFIKPWGYFGIIISSSFILTISSAMILFKLFENNKSSNNDNNIEMSSRNTNQEPNIKDNLLIDENKQKIVSNSNLFNDVNMKINLVVLRLSITVIFFNLLYVFAIVFYHMKHLKYIFEHDFRMARLANELAGSILLLKISIIGIFYFVFDSDFRYNFFEIIKN